MIVFAVFFVSAAACKSLDNEKKKTSADVISGSTILPEREPVIPGKKNGKLIAYKIIYSGSYINYEPSAGCEVIRSEKDLILKLKSMNVNEIPVKIDFDKQAVVFAFAGRFNTGGYGIKVIHAESDGHIAEVFFKVTVPGADVIVTQAFTQPYIAVLVDVDKNVKLNAAFFPEKEGNDLKEFDRF